MYQFIVLGLGFLLLVGGGYLIYRSNDGNSGVLKQAFSTSKNIKTFNASSTVETIVGVYACDVKSGCAGQYSLTLNQYGDVYLTHSDDNGLIQEHGTWNFEQNGSITLTLTDSSGAPYSVPRTILVQSVSKDHLSKLVFDNKIYTDMNSPVFTRQGE